MNNFAFVSQLWWIVPVGLVAIVLGIRAFLDFLMPD
jgi:hypothetical protein